MKNQHDPHGHVVDEFNERDRQLRNMGVRDQRSADAALILVACLLLAIIVGVCVLLFGGGA